MLSGVNGWRLDFLFCAAAEARQMLAFQAAKLVCQGVILPRSNSVCSRQLESHFRDGVYDSPEKYALNDSTTTATRDDN